MIQQIDPVKLKAAAEHLEWVCQQYHDNEDVQGLYRGFSIEMAGGLTEQEKWIVANLEAKIKAKASSQEMIAQNNQIVQQQQEMIENCLLDFLIRVK